MDPARAALRTLGCAAQIELGKVARSEWKSQMRRGRERRDVRGSERRTRARRTMMKDGAEFLATGVYVKHVLETLEKRRQRWIRKLIACS